MQRFFESVVLRIALGAAIGVLLTACAGGVQKTSGVYKVGDPYRVNGAWYYPHEDTGYDEVGLASWYGEPFHGRRTANGETFDADELTAAHKTLPMPVQVLVTNLQNNHSLVLRVNDRGPFVEGRIIDVSRRAAEVLGFKADGVTRVRVQYLGPGDRELPDSLDPAVLAQGGIDNDSALFFPESWDSPAVNQAYAAPVASVQAAPLFGEVISRSGAGGTPYEAWYVQVAALRDYGKVLDLQDRLTVLGPVEVLRIARGDEFTYRIRIGPLTDQEMLHTALAEVRERGHRDAYIVRE